MAKRPDITTVASGYFGREALNNNFQEIQSAFDNTLSLDGSIPNGMQADLDLNGYSIANAGGIIIGGQNVIALLNTSVSSVATSAAQALTSSNAAANSASAAAASAVSAAADAASAATTWGYISPYTTEIQIIADDLIDGSFVAGDIYDFGSITTPTTGTSGSPDGFIVTVHNNLADITTVAGIDTDVTTVAGLSADVSSVAAIDTDVTTVAGNTADISTVASISANVTSVAGNAANIAAVGAIASDVTSVASISADVTTVAGISTTDLASVAAVDTDVAALGPIAADVTTAAGNTTNITTVATNDANITTVAGVATDVTTVSGISANVTTVSGISADVTTVATVNADVSTVAGVSADVSTVAGITGNIATVVANQTDIADVATDIANVNTVAANLVDVNHFGETYRIGVTDPTTSLDIGDLFFNTTTGVLKVYDGVGWTAGVTAGSGFLPLTGGTLTGTLTLDADPTTAKGAATKEYVDTIAAAGLHYHDPVRVESPVDLPSTYSNGTAGVGATLTNSGTQVALVVDGVTLSTNDRVLLYHQSNAAHNGIYEVTDTGSASTNWVLTRTSDANTYAPSDPNNFGQGDAFFVQEGTTGAGELYVMNTSGAITFGTTAITFTQISSAAIYSAGTGVSFNGTEINIGQSVGTTDSPTFNSITVTGTVDGRNVSADGTKLDGIATGATNYADADVDAHLNQSTATTGDYLSWNGTDYDWAPVPAGYADADVDTHLNTSSASSGEVLQWDGTDYDWAPVDAFPSGTKMLFQQTSAPTGWTKDTTHNNKALRVVSGTAGSGGTSSFTTIFANRTSSSTAAGGTVGSRTLSVSQMPSHNHTLLGRNNAGADGNLNEFGDTHQPQTRSNTTSILYNGGSGSHNHSFSGSSHSHTLDMRVQYVDLIIATKN